MRYETVLVEKEDQVATITMNRPSALNALTPVMHAELAAAAEELGRDSAVKVVILTGAGKGFCSGADRSPGMWNTESGEAIREGTLRAGRPIINLCEMEKPVIAAVNGAAAGGGLTLALSCDVVVASEKAKFTWISSRVGVTPDMGAAYLLPRVPGMLRASELIMSGRIVDAYEAERLGLVSRVVPHESLASITRELALDLAQRSAVCLALTKKMVRSAFSLDLRGAIELEAYAEALSRGNAESMQAWDAWGSKN